MFNSYRSLLWFHDGSQLQVRSATFPCSLSMEKVGCLYCYLCYAFWTASIGSIFITVDIIEPYYGDCLAVGLRFIHFENREEGIPETSLHQQVSL